MPICLVFQKPLEASSEHVVAWIACVACQVGFFLFSQLLPAVASGTVEVRSIVEPVRSLLKDKVWAFLLPYILVYIYISIYVRGA